MLRRRRRRRSATARPTPNGHLSTAVVAVCAAALIVWPVRPSGERRRSHAGGGQELAPAGDVAAAQTLGAHRRVDEDQDAQGRPQRPVPGQQAVAAGEQPGAAGPGPARAHRREHQRQRGRPRDGPRLPAGGREAGTDAPQLPDQDERDRDARRLLLATHVGDEELSHDHGAPLRLVAPDHRGFQWIKWVTRLELTDGPDPGAIASTVWSSFTPEGRGSA